jgi:hypothetical protein
MIPVNATPADLIDPAATVTMAPADGAPVEMTVTSTPPRFSEMSDDEKRAVWSDVTLLASVASLALSIFNRRR